MNVFCHHEHYHLFRPLRVGKLCTVNNPHKCDIQKVLLQWDTKLTDGMASFCLRAHKGYQSQHGSKILIICRNDNLNPLNLLTAYLKQCDRTFDSSQNSGFVRTVQFQPTVVHQSISLQDWT